METRSTWSNIFKVCCNSRHRTCWNCKIYWSIVATGWRNMAPNIFLLWHLTINGKRSPEPKVFADGLLKRDGVWPGRQPQNKSQIFSGAMPSISNASKMIQISGFLVASARALNSAQPALPDWMVRMRSTILARVESDIQSGNLAWNDSTPHLTPKTSALWGRPATTVVCIFRCRRLSRGKMRFDI